MSPDNVTPIRPTDGPHPPQKPQSQPRGRRNATMKTFSDLEARLVLCRQTLTCATVALGKAEDDDFEGDTGPIAIRVIEHCVEELLRFEQDLNGWHMKQRTTESSQS